MVEFRLRDYLFRGKTDTGAWVYGSLIHVGDFCCILDPDDDGPDYPYLDKDLGCIDGYVTPVDPDTVGQFTGWCSINHKRIFEGDIVSARMDYGPGGFFDSVVPIKFDEVNGGYEWQYFDMSTIKVIGNIYDNPELLKGD